MPFSRLDSRKDAPLGWMACFSGLESPKPALQTNHHQPFSRPESWEPCIPRSKIQAFQDPSHETPRQARQHAIFKTRLPKRNLLTVNGLLFGTGVTQTIPPNHPPPLLFKTRVMKTIHPQVQDSSFSRLKSWKHLPKEGNMPFSRLNSRKDTLLGWMACFFGTGVTKTSPPNHPPPRHENHPSPGPRSELFRTRVMKTPPQVRQHAIFKTWLPKRRPP